MHRFIIYLAVVLLASGREVVWADGLVGLDSAWKFMPGTSEASLPDPAQWRSLGFDDSAWPELPAPFWYGDRQPEPGTELSDMQGGYTCVFLRQRFVLSQPEIIDELELGAQSDDGFIAWINGQEVARFNMPAGEVSHDGRAGGALPEPIDFQTFTLSNTSDYLVAGANVLAIQAFNASLSGSSDFVINVSLTSSVDATSPFIESVLPPADAPLTSLTLVEVLFSEPVTGVDAEDLLINGTPATSLIAYSGSQYGFGFDEPDPGTVQMTWRANHNIRDLAAAPNAFDGTSWTYELDPDYGPTTVLISEFMADNNRTLNDAFGDDSDWIELHNLGSSPVDLEGWFLTDTTNNLAKWQFPAVSLNPKEYLLVFASGRDLRDPAAQLHTNFKLGADGGFLGLLTPTTNLVSGFSPAYPPQREDVSYGRDTPDPQWVGYFTQPTPGAPNSIGGTGFAPRVEFSHEETTFTDPFDLTLSLPDAPAGALIRYTLDGSPVTDSSPLYTSALRLFTTTQVRARAYHTELLPGPVRSRIYVSITPELRNFTTDLPIMILHNDGGGTVPASYDQPVMIQTFEPIAGATSLTNAPDHSTRGVFHIRGSSTLYYAKRSFFLETQDNDGFGRNVNLLGLPEESDWVLYAPNNFEPVLLHNPVAFELSRQMGQYASRTRFFVLFLNTGGGTITSANYNGIYVLEEKIKADGNRVDIDRLQPEQNAWPEVTGGYLLSVDRSAPGEGMLYAGGQAFNYLSPKYWDIVSPQRAAQEDYIRNYLDSFYDTLTGPFWKDPAGGYAAYLDLEAAINHHLQGVVTFNVDALRLSGYLHKPRLGKITMGPVWDFDRTQGSTDGRDFNPRIWRSTVGDRGTDMFNSSGTYSNPWYSRLFQDIDFWQQWIDRYQELRLDVLSDTNVHAIIDRFADEVRTEQPREEARWGIHPRSGFVSGGGFSTYFSGTYQGEVDWMKNWHSHRLDFMDNNFLPPPEFDLAAGAVDPGTSLTLTGPEGATLYYTLDGSDPRQAGGNVAPGARVYTGPVVLNENARVAARARDLSHQNLTGPNNPPLTTPWSGLRAATYVVERPPLSITEIMYHPAPPPAGNTNAADNFEFIELLNTGSETLDLPGTRFINGIEFTFTSTNAITALAPGERLVLVSNREAFASRYPSVPNVAGQYVGRLENGGEQITVVGRLQETILDLAYDDSLLRITDGFGFSLVPETEPLENPEQPVWRASRALGGSPGTMDPAPLEIPNVLISEALTHTDLPQVDSVELHNPTAKPVDIGGWWLTDDLRLPQKYQFPRPTILDSGEYRILTESEFTNSPAQSFRLSSIGDEVYLFSADETDALTGYLDGFDYGAARNGISFGRYRTSVGDDHFVAQKVNSLGSANGEPLVGPVVINEIMYQTRSVAPPDAAGLEEFMELRNITASTVSLFDPDAATNTWRIRGGVDYNFPTNVTLLPNEHALIVGFNPDTYPVKSAAFRDRYGLAASTKLFGPFEGRLNNTGDRVRLLSPDTPQPATSPTPGYVPYVQVDQIDYTAASPWPTNAVGSGDSLQRIRGGDYGNDPVNWEAATASPGQVNRSTGTEDGDSDGLPDAWETAWGLDPEDGTGDQGALGDPDQDLLTNSEEWLNGLNPLNPDTDEDGLPDGWETQQGLNPANRLGPNGADGDPDADQLPNHREFDYGTDPWNGDTDSDLLPDSWEVEQGLNPTDPTGDHGADGDPDGDGLRNLQEWQIGTHPLDPASSFRLQVAHLGNGRIRLSYRAIAGRTYQLLTREETSGEWRVFRTMPSASVDSVSELIFTPGSGTDHFYQLSTPLQ